MTIKQITKKYNNDKVEIIIDYDNVKKVDDVECYILESKGE